MLEPDDRRLIRALQLAPRASFARIAEVLGMHERTASRRYNALRRRGVVRLVGVVNPLAVGMEQWGVRIHCRPDAAEALARALGARPDVVWIGIDKAGAEVDLVVRTLSEESRDLLLTRTLPRSSNVLRIEASVAMHVFLGLGSRQQPGFEEVLTDDETAAMVALGPGGGAGRPPVELEPSDSVALDLLAADGRTTAASLAEAMGISEGRAARRLARLVDTRTVVVDVDLAPQELGYHVLARLHLVVAPARLQAVGEGVVAFPEVRMAAAMSGRDNLMVGVVCRDLGHLYELTSARIGALEGVVSMEIVLGRLLKLAGGPVVDGRLVEP